MSKNYFHPTSDNVMKKARNERKNKTCYTLVADKLLIYEVLI